MGPNLVNRQPTAHTHKWEFLCVLEAFLPFPGEPRGRSPLLIPKGTKNPGPGGKFKGPPNFFQLGGAQRGV